MRAIVLILFCTITVVRSFSCTGITKSDNESVLMGANFDWYNPYSKIKFLTKKEGEYGVAVIGFGNLLRNQGVNDAGLGIDFFWTPYLEVKDSQSNEVYIGDLFIKILKECRSVDEALKLLNKYNLQFLSTSQMLIADSNGDSVIVEGDNIIRNNNKDYQVVTNFYLSKVNNGFIPCSRYRVANELIKYSAVDVESFKKILSKTTQSPVQYFPTTYSYIFDLKKNTIYLYNMGDFSNELVLNFEEELLKGEHIIDFTKAIPNKAYNSYLEEYKSSKPKIIKSSKSYLKKFTGIYDFGGNYGEIKITLNKGKLFWTQNKTTFEMIPYGDNKFFFEEEDFKIIFPKNKTKIESLSYIEKEFGSYTARRTASIGLFNELFSK